MIVDLHKYLLVGNTVEIDRFFQLAQRAGFMEFIGLSHKKALELPEDAKTIIAAIKIARQHSPDSHTPYQTPLSPIQLAEEILAKNQEYLTHLEEQRILNADIARIAPFGDFSRLELDKLERDGKRVFQFFCRKSDLANDHPLPPEVIYVTTEYDLDYFVAINKERTQYPRMIEIIIDKPIGELRSRLAQVKSAQTSLEKEIHNSAQAIPYLQTGLNDLLNEYYLHLAKHDVATPLDGLFAIEAWIPKTKVKGLQGLLSGLDIYFEQIAIEPSDKIPTYMENRGVGKVGEDLVFVYDTPAASDKDPSIWILIFFSFFFAMIISDAGYGLIYLLIGLFLKWKFRKATGFGKRIIKLIMILGSCCIVWGVLTASFFGIEIGPNNPFRRTSFIHYLAVKKAEYHVEMKDDVYKEVVREYPAAANATDGHEFLLDASKTEDGKISYPILNDFYDSILLEFSLLVGIIHISFSFLRYLTRNWVGFGWILFMIGGYLYFPSFLEATSLVNFMGWISKPLAYAIGKQLLYGGLILVFIFAYMRRRFWGALHELTNSIQIFADVLSYLRLYALALAGMVMASTFNELGLKLGLVAGVCIILAGHLVNLTLSIQSGVIHGLRLNFLEWYHYSFEGGGQSFNPLRLRKSK